jgi:Protein of unknown function (DUF2800)
MNADAHHTRGHSVWSASATSRNAVCAGAIAMETMCEDRETEAAAWGTCAHQIGERCLRVGTDANQYLGDIEKSGKFEFVVDDEMDNCSQEYVDYCRGRLAEYKAATGEDAQFWVEKNFSLEKINPSLEAGGTCDCTMYFPLSRLLEIVDLKGGRGVVIEVAGNPQMRSYALGAMLNLPNILIETVRVTIVQPRAQHRDGAIRSETFHVADLLEWAADLLGLMRRSRQALDEFNEIQGDSVAFDAWAEKWLTTGQCIFCPAKAICPKVREEVLARIPEVAAKWFEDIFVPTPSVISNLPRTGSPEQLAHDLDGLEMIEEWISALRMYAHAQAENGVNIPGYQLADRIGNRAWIDEVKASESLAAMGLPEKQIFEQKFKSPAQIEKILGSKRKAEIEPLVHRPVRGTNLVAASKTTRPPAASKVETYFEKL